MRHAHRLRPLLRACLLAILYALPIAARALDPSSALDGYRHDRWGEQEGAPRLVDTLAQTEDGWLWVASRQGGLFRFDGARFHPYVSVDGSRPQLPGISVLRPAPDGTLWIGYGRGGLTTLRDGRYTHLLTPKQAGSVFAIAIGRDGAAWVAGRRGLFRVAGGRVETLGAAQGYAAERAEYVLADRAGRIWATDGSALYVLGAGASRFERVREAQSNPLLAEAHDGSVWLVQGKEFERVAPPSNAVLPAPPGHSSSFQSLFDRDGNLWSGNCPVGVCVLRAAQWQGAQRVTPVGAPERLDQPWQMTSLSVLSVMEDRDGSIWIGTPAGLERLREQAVHMIGDLFDRGKAQVARHPDGSLYMVQVQKYDDTSRLARITGARIAPLPDPLDARALDTAPDGSLVVAGQRGIAWHGKDGVRQIALPPAVAAAAGTLRITHVVAGQDELWLWAGRLGVWHYRHGDWMPPPASLDEQPVRIAVDGAGRVYNGLPGNRVRIADGAAVTEYGPEDGVHAGRFAFISAEGPLLISGDEGTQVFAAGRFRDLRTTVPGGVGMISGLVRGSDGVVWLNAERGILRVAPADWARTLADPGIPLRGRLYDAVDGYVGGADTWTLTRTAVAAADGRLWFSGERGLAWLDPRTLPPATATPDVEVLALTARGRRYPAAGSIRLPEGTEDVQIDYAAPALRMPQRVTFRYRLAGDAAWEDAGTRRTAFYPRLSPGEHTFEVMAFNESGVASAVTTLRFAIAPRLTQTWWFYGGCALAALLLAAFAYRARTRRLAERIEDRLLARVRERESIARSLHDTFLQSVQGMILSLHSVMMKLPADSPVRGEFERVLQRAEHVLVEGRDEVKGLRGGFATAAEFWDTLLRDVEVTAPRGGGRVRLVAPEAIGRLQAHLHRDVYAIAREALTNALRHTGGIVTLHADAAARAFTLSIRDEGTGLGEHAHGKAGHFGLQGMRERAAQIGARLHFDSGETGTAVILLIPAALAYAGEPTDTAGVTR